VVIRRQLKRRYVLAFFQKLPPCLVGIEACASSHHWSRELKALGHFLRGGVAESAVAITRTSNNQAPVSRIGEVVGPSCLAMFGSVPPCERAEERSS
jgi:transposase